MSYPAINHVQYRLTAESDGTRLRLTHQAMGQIPQEVQEGAGQGWEYGLKRIREIAERLKGERRS
jgi:predicted component of type VI protein secretion system